MIFNGLEIVFTPYALAETKVRNFPFSKHRSARIRKKLIKRFGSEFVMEPAMYRMGGKIIAHPKFRYELEQRLKTW